MNRGRLYFGGSFNPIHNGHLRCAAAVARKADFEQVVLVPSATPPHKIRQNDLACPEDRLTMCRIAQVDCPLFEVDDLEVGRCGPSYTLDTVEELRKRGVSPVVWLIGADMLCILPQWHRAEELLQRAEFLIMRRPGFAIDWDTLPPVFRRLQANVIEAPLIDLSATEIRRRLARGEAIDGMLPPGVEHYIRAKGLYGASPHTRG